MLAFLLLPALSLSSPTGLPAQGAPQTYTSFQASPACRGPSVQRASEVGPAPMVAVPLSRMPRPHAEKAVVRRVDGCMVPVRAGYQTEADRRSGR